MPVKGFKTVTIKTDLYRKLREKADNEGKSVAKVIQDLVESSGEVEVPVE